MLKFFISVVVLAAVIGCCAGIYHLYKVKAKNAAEMAKFESEVPFTADLGKVLVAYYKLCRRIMLLGCYRILLF
jgi:hypothetical protein